MMDFYPYQNNFPELFAKAKNRISKTIGDYHALEIGHIGSTAIAGMAGKGIIDIAILLDDQRGFLFLNAQFCFEPPRVFLAGELGEAFDSDFPIL